MKNLILTFVLLLACSMTYAQKSYVTVICQDLCISPTSNLAPVYLSGDVPSTMKREYKAKDIEKENGGASATRWWIGQILNLLAKEGFEVEKQNSFGDSNTGVIYLLSKDPEKESKK